MALSFSPLRREELDALLARLDPDRDAAAAGSEALRHRLQRYFDWEGSPEADALADEVLTRLARKLAAGEPILNLPGYAAGIARLLALEHRRALRKRDMAILVPVESKEDRGQSEKCLERCLERLPADSRSLILRYYDGDAGARIRNRSRLAKEFSISLNSLRNRALRMRDRLESCLNGCLEARDGSPGNDTHE